MNDYQQMCSVKNLRKAFLRLLTNPTSFYKNFFRDAYQAYKLTLEDNLISLSNRLLSGFYQPRKNERLFLPKLKCLIRPYALLTVEDQIVYQACANIVAEKLHPHIKNRHGKITFGNIFAGRNSKYFYKDWKFCYKKFSRKVRQAVKLGFNWVATFDVTACYDSIDHAALHYYLDKFKVDPDLIDFILKCLSVWSCVGDKDRIHLNRGIPQGPLSSGIFSEVILQHLDENIGMSRGRFNRLYLRYVDDIRIYGQTEESCIKVLIRLDIAARQVGLFCQGSKTKVSQVDDYRYEIKTISLPEDDNVTVDDKTPYSKIEQDFEKVVTKLTKQELPQTGGTQKKDPGLSSKIKYLCHRIIPSEKNDRLMTELFLYSPSEYYLKFVDYLGRHESVLSQELTNIVLEHILKQNHFDTITAKMLDAAINRLPDDAVVKITNKILARPGHKYQPILKASALVWLLSYDVIEEHDLASYLDELDWWSLKEVIRRCPASYVNDVVTFGMQCECEDVVRCASMKMLTDNLDVDLRGKINETIAKVIKEYRVSLDKNNIYHYYSKLSYSFC